MNKLIKLFKIQFKILIVIVILILIVGSVMHRIDRSSYIELSKQEFQATALTNHITTFNADNSNNYRLEFELASGEKYYHEFQSETEANDFESFIVDNHRTIKIKYNLFYKTETSIFILIIGVLYLNFLLFWLVSIYDFLKNNFKQTRNKWVWFISFVCIPIITPTIYLLSSIERKRMK